MSFIIITYMIIFNLLVTNHADLAVYINYLYDILIDLQFFSVFPSFFNMRTCWQIGILIHRNYGNPSYFFTYPQTNL